MLRLHLRVYSAFGSVRTTLALEATHAMRNKLTKLMPVQNVFAHILGGDDERVLHLNSCPNRGPIRFVLLHTRKSTKMFWAHGFRHNPPSSARPVLGAHSL